MVRLLTVSEVGEYLGVSVKSVYQMIYMGKLPYVKMGPYRSSRVRFRQSDIDSYINDCFVEAYRERA